METYYVVQRKFYKSSPWEVLLEKFDTVQAAKEAMEAAKKRMPGFYRVAEAYYQVRYKAVKM